MDKFIDQAINTLKAVENTKTINKLSISYMMTQIRQHLEVNGLKDNYRILNFYCDWCLHSQLDRNPVAKELFQQLDKAITDDETWINDAVNRIISIHQLRADLIQVTGSVGANAQLFNSMSSWKNFVYGLLSLIVEKPLKRTPSTNNGVEMFMLEPVKDPSTELKDFLEIAELTMDVTFWKALIMPQKAYFIGYLVIAEHLTDFKFGR